MEIEYLTSLCKLRVDDFKVWLVVLGFQKNTINKRDVIIA